VIEIFAKFLEMLILKLRSELKRSLLDSRFVLRRTGDKEVSSTTTRRHLINFTNEIMIQNWISVSAEELQSSFINLIRLRYKTLLVTGHADRLFLPFSLRQ